VAVPATNTLVAVPVMKMLDAVVRVLPIEIVQLEVLSDADSEMSVTYAEVAVDCTAMPVAVDCTAIPEEVLPTKTAVDVNNGTSIKNHAVPSFAMAQSVLLVAVDVIGKKRLVADTVFGVPVAYLNVTVFAEPFDHEPVYVQTRNTFAPPIPCGCSNPNGGWSRLPPSTLRTAAAIRCAAGRVNFTKRLLPAPWPAPPDAPWLMRHPSTIEITSCVPVVAAIAAYEPDARRPTAASPPLSVMVGTSEPADN